MQPKSEKCFEVAEKPAETLATQATLELGLSRCNRLTSVNCFDHTKIDVIKLECFSLLSYRK